MLALVARFPVGMYHAQAQSGFAEPEWPPHPLRLIAALVAASRAGSARDDEAGAAVVDRVAGAGPPVIIAPRLSGEDAVVAVRGASRWAPRNHEPSELKKGISPRDLGRGRAEVEKIGVAIGDRSIVFAWPDLELDAAQRAALEAVVQDVTVIGTSRSPVILSVDAAFELPAPEAKRAWRPGDAPGAVVVRVADARSPRQFDAWHDQRRAGRTRDGGPAKSPLVVVPRIGVPMRYVHDEDAPAESDLDPRVWGDMLVLAVAGDVRPKAASAFAFARATRMALLAAFGEEGSSDEAPPILRGHGGEPHAAFVPLSVVGDHRRADGRTLGIGVVLPHEDRVADVLLQRATVVERLAGFVASGGLVRVPGVGVVRLVSPDGVRRLETLEDARWRRVGRLWTTVTPMVASRYLARRSRTGRYDRQALVDQVARDCVHVGLPRPRGVEERRLPRLPGSPRRALINDLPHGWRGPAEGPRLHVDLEFDRPVVGPILLGRARHFGLGLCLPYAGEGRA